jgi:hypothetical protein
MALAKPSQALTQSGLTRTATGPIIKQRAGLNAAGVIGEFKFPDASVVIGSLRDGDLSVKEVSHKVHCKPHIAAAIDADIDDQTGDIIIEQSLNGALQRRAIRL